VLANLAVMDLDPTVRKAAAEALEGHAPKTYLPALLKAMRYPWPAVADNAADALGTRRLPAKAGGPSRPA
jgi:HEAT repeat protein